MKLEKRHFPTLASTNSFAKEHIQTFDRGALTWLTADEQTGGRGRFGRQWISPKEENLYGTFVFFVDENQEELLSLTHVLAISASQLLNNKGVKAKIKWPNDVMVERKKIAGILCETVHLPPQFGVVIGIGLNVNMQAEKLETVGQPATSLFVETGKLWDCKEVGEELATMFQGHLEQFLKEGFSPLLPQFRALIWPG